MEQDREKCLSLSPCWCNIIDITAITCCVSLSECFLDPPSSLSLFHFLPSPRKWAFISYKLATYAANYNLWIHIARCATVSSAATNLWVWGRYARKRTQTHCRTQHTLFHIVYFATYHKCVHTILPYVCLLRVCTLWTGSCYLVCSINADVIPTNKNCIYSLINIYIPTLPMLSCVCVCVCCFRFAMSFVQLRIAENIQTFSDFVLWAWIILFSFILWIRFLLISMSCSAVFDKFRDFF